MTNQSIFQKSCYALGIALVLSASVFAENEPSKSLKCVGPECILFGKETPTKTPEIVPEIDQTDVFAIPLDEDEYEQNLEIYQLEHPKAKQN